MDVQPETSRNVATERETETSKKQWTTPKIIKVDEAALDEIAHQDPTFAATAFEPHADS